MERSKGRRKHDPPRRRPVTSGVTARIWGAAWRWYRLKKVMHGVARQLQSATETLDVGLLITWKALESAHDAFGVLISIGGQFLAGPSPMIQCRRGNTGIYKFVNERCIWRREAETMEMAISGFRPAFVLLLLGAFMAACSSEGATSIQPANTAPSAQVVNNSGGRIDHANVGSVTFSENLSYNRLWYATDNGSYPTR